MIIWTILNPETGWPFEMAFKTERAATQYAKAFGNISWVVTPILLHTEKSVEAIVYLEA